MMREDVPPPDVLITYQQVWMRDRAQVKVWEKSRRIGASYVEALDSAIEAAKSPEAGGQNTYYLSYNKEMTQQFTKDVAFWAKHINAVASEVEEVVLRDEDEDITVYRVKFASGFEVWGLPSVPRSLRSKQGRVVIDEAAFVDDLGELIKSAMALLMWGGCVRIMSTHNGDDNPFNTLVKDIREGRTPYSLHRTTLDDALTDGLYRRICLVGGKTWSETAEAAWREELIQFYKDGADEELFCIPQRSGTRYFTRDLLESCADPDVLVVRKACKDEFTFQSDEYRQAEFDRWFGDHLRGPLLAITGPSFLGEDFARSGDLTCIEVDERAPDGRLLARVVIELRNVPFKQQWQTIKAVCQTLPNFAGGAFDSRGNGQQIAEYAAQEWPGLVHQVMITARWYAENFPRLRGRMEDLTTTIAKDNDLMDDFRVVGLKAGVPQILERTGEAKSKRHGDGAIAKLMALFAALEDPGTSLAVATTKAGGIRSMAQNIIQKIRRPR